MSLFERFKEITARHDDELFLVFKEIIEKAKTEAEDKNMNGVVKYNYINSKIEETYVMLASLTGVVDTIKDEETRAYAIQKCIINPPVSEKLEEKIYDYIKSQENEARDYIKSVASKVLESDDVETLTENYKELENLMQLIDSSIYSDIELDIPQKRCKSLKKQTSNNMGISMLDLYGD